MVVGSSAFFLDGGDSVDVMAGGNNAAMANKCRYKTGKCMNQRSSKRNGQAHMLCLYHRDKANKIQRKFDRQKRQSARMSKSSSSPSAGSPSNLSSSGSRASMGIAGGAALAFAHSMAASTAGSSSSFTGLLKQEIDIYSDSESSRFSTDSESSVASQLDQVWRDVPNVAMLAGLASPTAHSNLPSPVATRFHSTMSHGQLSHDEIDFLYAAMLE